MTDSAESAPARHPDRLPLALLLLRLGVFVVMALWTVDKFLNPDHTAGVWSTFYGVDGLASGMSYAVGGVQAVIVLAFGAGLWKRWSYGLVLAMHTVSTLSTWERMLDPWSNLLFFAAWPMLAAIVALYLLRDEDRLGTLG